MTPDALWTPRARPLWLVTLADLSLLLLGFFVLIQASARDPAPRRAAIAAGIRDAFGGTDAPRLAVAANRIDGFASGYARLPRAASAALAEWARQAAADPRSHIVVTGHATPAEGLALAAARAEAAARALPVDRARLRLAATVEPGAGHVALAISYDP
ncbi:flagellar motor protein MotB [Sphingomonas changnyeongensis]|uniref:Flagellar motor protein MotB n=1 Tax=Sphingomonas changnyeongensis TaxID=2698679 RepID=A0A7Z2NVG2_9SPHN|nr:flagellar motor protein MotB [Sphingomonas changnyeongensis]QHL90159.1 flagellar motor protein MotB [Sphingomonas changnyeongensis]